LFHCSIASLLFFNNGTIEQFNNCSFLYMKAVIFAGGSGVRLWPLSRRKSPKQFEKIIGDKSTLQLAVDRLTPDFDYSDIYISTNVLYADIVKKQLPEIPGVNFFFEPEKKDVAPAIALAMGIISKSDPKEPVAILWI